MIDLDQIIFWWETYLAQHENELSDQHLKVITSTIDHLKAYKKMKEQVHVKLPLSPDNPNR